MLLLVSVGMVMPLHVQAAKESDAAGDIELKNTEGKDASDIAALRKLLKQQKEQGFDVSDFEDVDEGGFYSWTTKGELTEINITLKGKVTLKGFKNLDMFLNDNGEMTELSVSKCPSLLVLQCSKNKLTKLDVSKCSRLQQIIADKNLKIPGWKYSGLEDDTWVKK